MLPDPFVRFGSWFDEAKKKVPVDPNAMTISSVDARGRPSSRVVLLKGFDARGFIFYTNYESRKGRELLGQKWAALCFHWKELERQVRIEGAVEPVSKDEADAYFATRERGSQIGAWASKQSSHLETREELEQRVLELEKKYEGQPVPRPPFWSGFRIIPDRIEFWTARISRLHEREVYTREGTGPWHTELLYP